MVSMLRTVIVANYYVPRKWHKMVFLNIEVHSFIWGVKSCSYDLFLSWLPRSENFRSDVIISNRDKIEKNLTKRDLLGDITVETFFV